jgi:hypothetical protein
LGLFTRGDRLTNLGYRALGARGAKGAFLAILDEGAKGAFLLKSEEDTGFTLLTEGARGARGAGRKAKHWENAKM